MPWPAAPSQPASPATSGREARRGANHAIFLEAAPHRRDGRRAREGYEIVEEGLGARTTSIDGPVDPPLSGSAYLPAALASHLPLDLVTLMLGTNDTKSYCRRSP